MADGDLSRKKGTQPEWDGYGLPGLYSGAEKDGAANAGTGKRADAEQRLKSDLWAYKYVSCY